MKVVYELLKPVDFLNRMASVLICLLFIIAGDFLSRCFRVKEKAKSNKVSELHLEKLAIPELGQKYLRSCK